MKQLEPRRYCQLLISDISRHVNWGPPLRFDGIWSDSIVKIALVICPITVYTVIGLTTYCILTIESLQGLSLLRWGPQLWNSFKLRSRPQITTWIVYWLLSELMTRRRQTTTYDPRKPVEIPSATIHPFRLAGETAYVVYTVRVWKSTQQVIWDLSFFISQMLWFQSLHSFSVAKIQSGGGGNLAV